jgi:hypothetical protein
MSTCVPVKKPWGVWAVRLASSAAGPAVAWLQADGGREEYGTKAEARARADALNAGTRPDTRRYEPRPSADGPPYPQVRVQLTGQDGNTFAILVRCQAAMRDAGCAESEVDGFVLEAISRDYDHLLRTCTHWFDVQ